MTDERRLEIGLLALRLSIGAFFLVWSFEKILAPEVTQRVFDLFYLTNLPLAASYVLGATQTLIVLAFLFGFLKTWTYGALLAMHTVSVASTWQRLIDPYQPPNHLFWAGVPVLAAIAVLFALRSSDRLLATSD